ncbi:MAG TPA: NYN domain-containing protein [Candidatus Hydrogenedentes bacterium]|nr:NYN domain-containing protein [Candidatus Hydrogenedentota bacterium]HOS03007.1 NYN domain-containing protein [Candidatus Hydrogenedentota bacterium]
MPEYVVDGYNIIHHCRLLRPLIDQSVEFARNALIERLARFCATTGSAITLVFDGRSRQFVAEANLATVPLLRITYSEAGQTADALIERLVYNMPNRRDVIVVTGDQGIRQLCRGLGSLVMGPENFLKTVDGTVSSARDSLAVAQAKAEPARLEDRLDASSLRRLREMGERLRQGKDGA